MDECPFEDKYGDGRVTDTYWMFIEPTEGRESGLEWDCWLVPHAEDKEERYSVLMQLWQTLKPGPKMAARRTYPDQYGSSFRCAYTRELRTAEPSQPGRWNRTALLVPRHCRLANKIKR